MTTRAQAIAFGIRHLLLSYQGDRKEAFARACDALAGEVEAIGEAVAEVHRQTSDDRCHLDLAVLFVKFGLEPPDMRMPPKPEFLTSCERYYDQCTLPIGELVPGQMTMRQLEDEVARLTTALALTHKRNKALAAVTEGMGEVALDHFRAGAQAMREMLARFVEHGGDSPATVIVGSMRANWNPAWGKDPGRPERIVDSPWET